MISFDTKCSHSTPRSSSRTSSHLTPFLKFGLRGVALQSSRLAEMIRNEVSRQIFRNLMHEIFSRLESTRKRVIVKRQLRVLGKLLNAEGRTEFGELAEGVKDEYTSRKAPLSALVRDINRLQALGAVRVDREEPTPRNFVYYIDVQLDWPSRITETEFFAKLAALPKSKTYGFLSPDES
jgi:hypothetical protein